MTVHWSRADGLHEAQPQLVPRPCKYMEYYRDGRKESIVSWLQSSFAGDRFSVLFPTFKSICTVTVYTFRVRDQRTGNWRDSRRKMTIVKADKRYGNGNYEVVEDSKEVRLRRLLKKIFKFSK